jgi:putative membrane protein
MILKQSSKTISLLSAFFLLSALTAFAQTPGMQPGAPTGNQPTVGQAGPNGSYPDAAAPGTQASYADQMFLKDTLKDDQVQVQMSQLAQQKSSSDDVKKFSQNVVKVQTELDNQLKPLVKQFAISETQKPSKKDKEQLEKLQTLSGPDFDAAYLQAIAVEQQHALKQFKEEADAAQNLALQRTAKADQPILNQNFEVLQKLAAAHNVTLDSK